MQCGNEIRSQLRGQQAATEPRRVQRLRSASLRRSNDPLSAIDVHVMKRSTRRPDQRKIAAVAVPFRPSSGWYLRRKGRWGLRRVDVGTRKGWSALRARWGVLICRLELTGYGRPPACMGTRNARRAELRTTRTPDCRRVSAPQSSSGRSASVPDLDRPSGGHPTRKAGSRSRCRADSSGFGPAIRAPRLRGLHGLRLERQRPRTARADQRWRSSLGWGDPERLLPEWR